MPIYIVYFTAWVDGSGVPQFREDIYDRDEFLLEAVKGGSVEGDQGLLAGPGHGAAGAREMTVKRQAGN
jgi:hypothetical protein